ncbi:MAG: discoidin domain-containing protein [Caldilineaceae bacterium]
MDASGAASANEHHRRRAALFINQADGQLVVTASAAEEPNVAANVVDGDLDTRWSAEGDGQWVQLDLGAPRLVEGVQIAWFTGAQRTAYFDLLSSLDGQIG